jgi:chromatin segregation and condensation protein Rec8/ScpA/Scc1 (kleisin family)
MKSRMEIIVTFLAILDLVKEGACSVSQKDIFSDIQLVNLRSIV